MQFSKSILALSALASIVLADNTITFVNQDAKDRTVVFTPSAGFAELENLDVGGHESQIATFPYKWQGNFYSIMAGAPEKVGMLGELTFNAFSGLTFFDVSAIIDPNDVNQVKEIFPKNSNQPLAGCQEFPCDNAYNVFNDDLATKATLETDFVCMLGTLETTPETQRRRGVVADEKRDAAPTDEPIEQ